MIAAGPDGAPAGAAVRPILYFSRMFPAAYRVPVLRKLDLALGGRLVVCSGPPPRSSSLRTLTEQEAHGFQQMELRNLWLAGESVHLQLVGPAFRRWGRPAAILAEESPRSIHLPLLLRRARRLGVPTVLWGHFSSNRREFSPANLRDRYRLRLAASADACLCYTEEIADLLRPHLPAERVFVARNTLDTDTLFALRRDLEREGRTAVRRRLGIPGDQPVVLFLGRLIADKGTGVLLDLFKRLRARAPARLLVVGQGPEESAMRRRAEREGIDGVRFVGAMPRDEESAPYIFASDLLLIPGYLGLAVNHAFAFGVPVVSRAAPPGMRLHSPEAAYVVNGRNGFLCAHDDLEAMLGAVERVLAERETFSRNALDYAQRNLTVDRMIRGLVEAIEYARKSAAGPARGGSAP